MYIDGLEIVYFPQISVIFGTHGSQIDMKRYILMGPVCENLQQHTSTKFQEEYPPPPPPRMLVAQLVCLYLAMHLSFDPNYINMVNKGDTSLLKLILLPIYSKFAQMLSCSQFFRPSIHVGQRVIKFTTNKALIMIKTGRKNKQAICWKLQGT